MATLSEIVTLECQTGFHDRCMADMLMPDGETYFRCPCPCHEEGESGNPYTEEPSELTS